MRKISADYIFPISSEPIPNGIITIDDEGTIIAVTENSINDDDIEYYNGVICPGFINTHCHLELSHLRSAISEKKGMTNFVKEIISKREAYSEQEIHQAIADAEIEMINNGIVAIGDISNNNSSFNQKSKTNLYYHTFIEVFDLNPEKAQEVFKNACELQQQLLNLNLKSAIIPHAPHTVTNKLFKLIYDVAIKNNSILSIHNQESEGENELFVSKSGALFDAFSLMGINMDYITMTGKSSLQSIFSQLPGSQKKLFVHNTYTTKEDIESVLNNNKENVFWCTCPNANMYIEGRLPNYNYFIDTNAQVTIGTDSLASNWSLSILDELKTISKQYPEITLNTLLLWATKNGADFFGLKQFGAIENGKKPGLNLLKNIDGLKINDNSQVVKLV